MKRFIVVKVLLFLVCAIVLWQCGEQINQPSEIPQSMFGKGKGGGGNGGGGNGGGGHGGGGNGGGGGGGTPGGGGSLYGDLLVVLRTPNGVPVYKEVSGEHGLTYYPQPIMFDALTGVPVKTGSTYEVFDISDEGDIMPEEGYVTKEVAFGRINVVRAPQNVLDNALAEAKNSLMGAGEILTDFAGRLVAINGGAVDWIVNNDNDPLNDQDDDKTIDAPRENMAIYQELMMKGLGDELAFLIGYGYSDADVLRLASGALAGAADKTSIVIVDEVQYVDRWIIDWNSAVTTPIPPGGDPKGFKYYDFAAYQYNRIEEYSTKGVKITTLLPGGTYTIEEKSIYLTMSERGLWTDPTYLVEYSGNSDVSGFAMAADDAVQVIEFLHGSTLIEYIGEYP